MLVWQSAEPVDPPARIELLAEAPTGTSRGCSAEQSDDEIVVCGRADLSERYRLKPLPVVERDPGVFGKPLVLTIAPGVKIGFLGRGAGVKIDF